MQLSAMRGILRGWLQDKIPAVTFFGGVPGAPDTIPYTLTVTDDNLLEATYSSTVDITYWDAP